MPHRLLQNRDRGCGSCRHRHLWLAGWMVIIRLSARHGLTGEADRIGWVRPTQADRRRWDQR